MAGDLGDFLLKQGLLDSAAVARAQAVAAASGERLGTALTRLGLMTEAMLAEALAQCLDLPLAGPEDFPAHPVLADRITTQFLRTARVLPLAETAEGLRLAMADPLDSYASEAIALLVGRPVLPAVAVPAELEAALARLHGAETAPALPTAQSNGHAAAADVERLRDLASEAPVIRLVNGLIAKAVAARASDIHFEPFDGQLQVRFRVDGLLRPAEAPPPNLQAAIASRVKIMAGLDIAERRLAQDGRIRANVQGREIDLRVSTIPTLYGESIALRILDKEQAPLRLDALGFSPAMRNRLAECLSRSTGILLATGPTGSGKTTTLYAALQQLNDPTRKILTVEDPVEYQLPGINQIQVQPKIGLSFANALRSILRQDPDIIMVGEIRDGETARIAVQASLTGHLVLSTLHTNDAAGAVTRLIDMGVEDFLLTSALSAVLAQRLVRALCPLCKEAYRPLPELLRQIDPTGDMGRDLPEFHRPKGCAACHGTGYAGRTIVAELLVLDDRLRQLILARADRAAIAEAAVAGGMRRMLHDGLDKVLSGATSIDEVLRVTQAA